MIELGLLPPLQWIECHLVPFFMTSSLKVHLGSSDIWLIISLDIWPIMIVSGFKLVTLSGICPFKVDFYGVSFSVSAFAMTTSKCVFMVVDVVDGGQNNFIWPSGFFCPLLVAKIFSQTGLGCVAFSGRNGQN